MHGLETEALSTQGMMRADMRRINYYQVYLWADPHHDEDLAAYPAVVPCKDYVEARELYGDAVAYVDYSEPVAYDGDTDYI